MTTAIRTGVWVNCQDAMPPEDLKVLTKIDDATGVRNEQEMYFLKGLWWTGDGADAMYVYYNPTHWLFTRT